jgi:hypothetical protein
MYEVDARENVLHYCELGEEKEKKKKSISIK